MNIKYLLKNNARTIYLSAKILPKEKQKTFAVAYLVCRIADSVADTSLIEAKKRIEFIKNFPILVEHGNYKTAQEMALTFLSKAGENIYKNEAELLKNIDICIKEFKTLKKEYQKITLEVLRAVCKAMVQDLIFFPEENSGLIKALPAEKDTLIYCDYMGGQPGVFWAKLEFGKELKKETQEQALKIGRALQITNILRDIEADAKIGRIYLPLNQIIKQELMPQDLLEKGNYVKLYPVMLYWIKEAKNNLLNAKEFIKQIPRRKLFNRAAVIWPVFWSLDTIYLLGQNPHKQDKKTKRKITKTNIYLTMLLSPLYCFSNILINKIIDYKVSRIERLLGNRTR
ncbi:MAG: squalene/phytoene synthase family protein [Elusimicrobiaceae bacterium]|nr:squalene/phytoene synthase family protein [Elusimicrobiaceae bacterium]